MLLNLFCDHYCTTQKQNVFLIKIHSKCEAFFSHTLSGIIQYLVAGWGSPVAVGLDADHIHTLAVEVLGHNRLDSCPALDTPSCSALQWFL